MNAFFTSQFTSCLLVWMCHSRRNNSKINRHHKKFLRIVTWKRWLSLNSHRNIQILATEMYKLNNNLSSPIMNKVFKLNSDSHYNLWQISQFSRSLVKSVYHGTESISYLSQKYGIYYLMPIKPYKFWILLKSKLKN